jgi:hypothetical protein
MFPQKLHLVNTKMEKATAVFRSFAESLFLLSLLTPARAQDVPYHLEQPPKLERVQLTELSTVQISSLPVESMAMPIFCEQDGSILLRSVTPDAVVNDPVRVSNNGQSVIRFEKHKISDITRPVLLNVFPSGSNVYVLLSGSISPGQENRWRTPKNEIKTQQVNLFIARFSTDGRYSGAVILDLPFNPLQLGVFQNGQFLVAGADPATGEPRVAIVNSDGHLRRFLRLKGDVHRQRNADRSGKKKDLTAFPALDSSGAGKSLIDVVSRSQIASDGSNLLLFRQATGRVFSISSSGKVRRHNIKLSGNFELFTVKAARNFWVMELLRDSGLGNGAELSIYGFDPASDRLMRQYIFPKDFGWGLACTDGHQFTIVTADNEKGVLDLVKLGLTTNPN